MLASVSARATDPPRDLVRRAADRETKCQEARGNYTYRQTVIIEEMEPRGGKAGEYREVRDIIFSPGGERTEQAVGKPIFNLKRLILTPEDFHDLREVQPLLLTRDQLWVYESRFRGEETVDGVDCWVLRVAPRQILDGQRLFEGLLWIDKSDFSIVRSEGRAVPQLLGRKQENLFPRFTTIRQKVDGQHWFPVHTHGDDTLPFRNGPLRMRMTIRYENYKRFGADSNLRFSEPERQDPPR